jgi:hypothetical protein
MHIHAYFECNPLNVYLSKISLEWKLCKKMKHIFCPMHLLRRSYSFQNNFKIGRYKYFYELYLLSLSVCNNNVRCSINISCLSILYMVSFSQMWIDMK